MIYTLERIVREQSFYQGREDRHIQLIAGCAGNMRFDSAEFVF